MGRDWGPNFMAWNLLRQLRVEDSYETRRRRFFATARAVSVGFGVMGLLGAAQIQWSLWRGIAWHDAHGAVISRPAMWEGTLMFVGAAVLGGGMLWVLRRLSD
jgi:hypothetical protein